MDEIIRDLAKSSCITFGTTAPYVIHGVTCGRIGFASIPVVAVAITHAAKHSGDLCPIARQLAYQELEKHGIPSDCLALTPTYGHRSRRRKFVDANLSSASLGKNKMGYEGEWHFEITDPKQIPLIRTFLKRSYNMDRL